MTYIGEKISSDVDPTCWTLKDLVEMIVVF